MFAMILCLSASISESNLLVCSFFAYVSIRLQFVAPSNTVSIIPCISLYILLAKIFTCLAFTDSFFFFSFLYGFISAKSPTFWTVSCSSYVLYALSPNEYACDFFSFEKFDSAFAI